MSNEWFAVDKEGLAQLLARRGAWFAVLELIQNAWDEEGVTEVNVTLDTIEGRRGRALLRVEDDAPNGFADLTHAYTLFAPSAKKSNAEKRGRFNLGEKLVLAICDSASVVSTTGGYAFDNNGRRKTRTRRDRGSEFVGTIRMTREEVVTTLEVVDYLIVPSDIKVTVNGVEVEHRAPVHSFDVRLPTEIEGDEGQLRKTRRTCRVDVYEPRDGEPPMIYEMGIPVVETEDRWHVDVQQKVPLNMDRDNITPAYLRELRTAVLNETFDMLTESESSAQWVSEAIADPRVEVEAVRAVVTNRYGDDAVIYDPSDREANKIAAAEGRVVIHGGAFDKSTWENVRRAETFQPAGVVTPSNSTVQTDPDGNPPVPQDEWSDGMRRVAAYSQRVGRVLLGVHVNVSMHRAHDSANRWAAAYSPGELWFNVSALGKRWFDVPEEEKIDALLIHEFAHHRAKDHLSSAFYDECCRLGALLKQYANELRLDKEVVA